MYCGDVIYHCRSSLAAKSCNLFHPQLLPCVRAAISLNKHRQEAEMLCICEKGSQSGLKQNHAEFLELESA